MNGFRSAFPRFSLPGGIVIALLLSTLSVAAQAQSSPAGFRFEAVNEKSLGLWEGERPVLVYNHRPISSDQAPNAQSRSTYVHPIYGLDGEVLTDDFPADHVNHRGLYWAWPHIRIDGQEQEVGLWGLNGIRQEFQGWLEREAGPNGAALAVENGWFVGDRKVMRERIRFEVHPATATGRAIDVELTFTPIDRSITLWGSAGKSYGGFNLRFGPRAQTIITSPAGHTLQGEAVPARRATAGSEDLVMTRIPWADFSADLARPGTFSGISIFVHPDHPDYFPEWMTRNYGMLAVGWPGVNPRTFPAGVPFTMRYRLWIHRGTPQAAEIQREYDSYLAALRSR